MTGCPSVKNSFCPLVLVEVFPSHLVVIQQPFCPSVISASCCFAHGCVLSERKLDVFWSLFFLPPGESHKIIMVNYSATSLVWLICVEQSKCLWKDGSKEYRGTANGKPLEHQDMVLTPSLPQSVKCLGWKVHSDVPANSILFLPVTNLLSILCILMQSFHMLMQKRKQDGLRISSFTHRKGYERDGPLVRGWCAWRRYE